MSSPQSLARLLRDATGWLLIATLFYSPWDYGGTSAGAIRHLDWLLGVMLILWCAGLALRSNLAAPCEGRGRSSQRIFLSVSLSLLFLGWWMALNAHGFWDADYGIFLPLRSPFPNAPGSIDRALSIAMMWRVTTLLGGVWVVADLMCDERWLLRIWWALALAGSSIALLGLLQKATGATTTFWQETYPGEAAVGTFFATFYYHGNAGAFLNLALPAILGLAFRYASRPSHPVARALWITFSLIAIVAVFSDTSRMGQLIAVFIMLGLLILSAGKIFRHAQHLEWKTICLALLIGTIAIWAVTRVSHLDRSLERWDRTENTVSKDARWLVDEAAIHALPAAGLLGFGPGTFSSVFPYFNRLEGRAAGEWFFLHNDYLQTLLEWGWLGGLLIFCLFFGGVFVALRGLTNAEAIALSFRRRQFLGLAVVALVGLGLHAAVDFPLQISSIQLYAAIYLGVCWGSGSWRRL